MADKIQIGNNREALHSAFTTKKNSWNLYKTGSANNASNDPGGNPPGLNRWDGPSPTGKLPTSTMFPRSSCALKRRACIEADVWSEDPSLAATEASAADSEAASALRLTCTGDAAACKSPNIARARPSKLRLESILRFRISARRRSVGSGCVKSNWSRRPGRAWMVGVVCDTHNQMDTQRPGPW